MKLVSVLILSLVSMNALATGTPTTPPVNPQHVAAGAAAGAVASSDSYAASQARGGDASATGGESAANADSNSGGNTLSTTYKAVRNPPSIALAGVYPTASCQGGIGLGGSGPNGAGLVSFSFTKKECETVVLAQNFLAIGMPDVSCKILSTTKAFKRAGIKVDCSPAQPVASHINSSSSKEGDGVAAAAPAYITEDRAREIAREEASAVGTKVLKLAVGK